MAAYVVHKWNSRLQWLQIRPKYHEDFFRTFQDCEQDDQGTMPILQSIGELDPFIKEIWWKISDCGDVQVFNHIDGAVDQKIKLASGSNPASHRTPPCNEKQNIDTRQKDNKI